MQAVLRRVVLVHGYGHYLFLLLVGLLQRQVVGVMEVAEAIV